MVATAVSAREHWPDFRFRSIEWWIRKNSPLMRIAVQGVLSLSLGMPTQPLTPEGWLCLKAARRAVRARSGETEALLRPRRRVRVI